MKVYVYIYIAKSDVKVHVSVRYSLQFNVTEIF
jgi:hypothetical protein